MALTNQIYADIAALTGFGKFDLHVKPPATLDVIIKVHCTLDPRLTTDGRSFSLSTYLDAWQSKVSDMWDNKMRFRSQGDGGETLTARFIIRKVDTPEEAHFPLYINEVGYGAGSGVKPPENPAHVFGRTPFTTYFLSLGRHDNLDYATGGAGAINGAGNTTRDGVFNEQLTRIMKKAHAKVDVNLDTDRNITVVLNRKPGNQVYELTQGSLTLLNNLCAALNEMPPGLPLPPIKVKSESGITAKGNAIANYVVTQMRNRGVTMSAVATNVVTTSKKFSLPGSGHKATANVTIELPNTITMRQKMSAGQWVADYCVSAHEFGHLLGVPDEYLSYAAFQNETIKNSQPLWDQLCGAHIPMIPRRRWDNQFNDSIMSIGTKVYPAHAVTIWAALEAATGIEFTITSPA